MTDLLIKRGAHFSPGGAYRYTLERWWDLPGALGAQRLCTFIMLNPSTADSDKDDPTTVRCMAWARETGHNHYAAVNLFAFRSSTPSKMLAAGHPVGPNNDYWIKFMASKAYMTKGTVVCAWGAHGGHMGRDRVVLAMLASINSQPVCLRLTKHGHPGHPLYIPAPWKPIPMDLP